MMAGALHFLVFALAVATGLCASRPALLPANQASVLPAILPSSDNEIAIMPVIPVETPEPTCVTYIKKLLAAIIVRLPGLPSQEIPMIPEVPVDDEPAAKPEVRPLPKPDIKPLPANLPGSVQGSSYCAACFKYVQDLLVKANAKIVQ